MNKKSKELFTIPTKELKDKINIFLEQEYGDKFVAFKEMIKKYITDSLIEYISSKQIIINIGKYEEELMEATSMPTEGILFYLFTNNIFTYEKEYEFNFSINKGIDKSILILNFEYLNGINEFEYKIEKNIQRFERTINMSDTYALLVKNIEEIITDKIKLCFKYASAYATNKENTDEKELEKELVLLLADQNANTIFKEANNIENQKK